MASTSTATEEAPFLGRVVAGISKLLTAPMQLLQPTLRDVCQQTRDSTQQRLRSRLRDKFGRPEGFGSCAIVGSSGLLLRTRLGAEIDGHGALEPTPVSRADA